MNIPDENDRLLLKISSNILTKGIKKAKYISSFLKEFRFTSLKPAGWLAGQK